VSGTEPELVQLPLQWWTDGHDHPRLSVCPACDQSVDQVAMVDLGYTWVVCRCHKAPYPHLIEQVWHLDHMVPDGAGVAARARRKAIATVITVIRKELNKGEKGAPARQQLTYTGGLRRALRLLEPILGAALDAEKAATPEDRL
jgi:hypothetical protein